MSPPPLVLICAPNGARRQKLDHNSLPIAPGELADCAEQVLAAGASVLHLHVRDDSGAHSLDAARYRSAISAVRERVGDALVIQVTTEACGVYQPAEQMQLVEELRPEAVSLALQELCPQTENEPRFAEFLRALQADHVLPQYILYSRDDVERFLLLLDAGTIPRSAAFVLLGLGRYSVDRIGDPDELSALREPLDEAGVPWAVCCFSPTEQAAVRVAAKLGGHARVGFENNLLLPDGSQAPNNAALVERAAAAARDAGRPLADAATVRSMFSSSPH